MLVKFCLFNGLLATETDTLFELFNVLYLVALDFDDELAEEDEDDVRDVAVVESVDLESTLPAFMLLDIETGEQFTGLPVNFAKTEADDVSDRDDIDIDVDEDVLEDCSG